MLTSFFYIFIVINKSLVKDVVVFVIGDFRQFSGHGKTGKWAERD